MKAWLITARTDREKLDHNPWEDSDGRCYGFIIMAENEKRAREIAQENSGDEGYMEPWIDSTYSTCEELKSEGVASRDCSARDNSISIS